MRSALLALGLILCASLAHANGPIVITGGNLPGYTGASLHTSGTASGTAGYGVPDGARGFDYGGLCLSARNDECSGNGLYQAVATPNAPDGLQKINGSPTEANLVLVPTGVLNLTCTSSCPDDVVASMTFTGSVTYQRGGGPTACLAKTGALGGTEASSTTFSTTKAFADSACPWDSALGPTGLGRLDTFNYAVTGNLDMQVYAAGALTPGVVNMPPLYFGYFTGHSLSEPGSVYRVNLPDEVIVPGLTCSLAPGANINGGHIGAGAHAVNTWTAPGTPVFAESMGLNVTCAGTNDTAVTLTEGVAFTPQGPDERLDVGAPYKLRSDRQPGYYATVNNDLTAECNAGISLLGNTPSNIATYAPGDPAHPAGDTRTYTVSLCGTGNPQAPGSYALAMLVTLVTV